MRGAAVFLGFLAGCTGTDLTPPDARVIIHPDAKQAPDARVVPAPDAAPAVPQTFGAPCTCDGSECDNFGVPQPSHGTIHGCDDVPASRGGGQRACLRSYNGTFGPSSWFANGYCALMAASCDGASLICGSATTGDWAAMADCPAGTVLLEDDTAVTVLGQSATVHTKFCVRACDGAGDCRESESDPVWDAASQQQCNDKGGVKFCYDPRNLGANYTVKTF